MPAENPEANPPKFQPEASPLVAPQEAEGRKEITIGMVLEDIRFEERELFPWISNTLSEETRETIEKILHEKFHRLAEPETPIFWE